ncbi:MAG: ABC-2 family transporter protein [Christensenellaceae bacterium]|nr:ABC-2 family transporter protein [Christensenellaceae bacterium]
MRYVLHSMKMLWKSATQYRSSLVMQIIAQLIMTAGDLLAVLVLMDRFLHIGRWQPAEVLFFFGVMQLTFAMTECFNRGLGSFEGMIGSGAFDSVLLRPRGLLLQVICSQLDPRRFGSFLVGGAAVALASRTLGLRWTAAKALLFGETILGSLMLLMGLFLIEATMCFFSVRSIEMVNALTYGGRSTCQYPIDIYPKPLRLLFLYVAPIALCMHLPVSVILDRPMFAVPGWCVWAAPLTGLLFFLLMVRAWYFGVRHYRSTGS